MEAEKSASRKDLLFRSKKTDKEERREARNKSIKQALTVLTMIKLETSSSTLFYFPPDDGDDIPRYAVQSAKQKLYEKFIPLFPEDKLLVQENGDTLVVVLAGYQLGSISKKSSAKLEQFIDSWNQGLEFLRTNEIKKTQNRIDTRDGSTATLDDEANDGIIQEQISLKRHLENNSHKFIKNGELKLRFVTWNLHGDQLYNRADQLSSLFLNEQNEGLDLYFVAFQEIVPLSAKNLRSSAVPIEHWIDTIFKIIGKGYKVVQTNKLLGLASILIVKEHLAINITNLEIHSIGTGILNFYGNKGAILTNFKFNDYHFSFLDCHFAAGENDSFLLKRRKELHGIKKYLPLVESNGSIVSADKSILFDVDELDGLVRDLELESDEEEEEEDDEEQKSKDLSNDSLDKDPKEKINSFSNSAESKKSNTNEKLGTPDTEESTSGKENEIGKVSSQQDLDKNIIFIGGDMNYRLSATFDDAKSLIEEKDYKTLLTYDTLSREKDRGRIFDGFDEGEINFSPTYKIIQYDRDYDKARIPSYTDRIFHSKSQYVKIDQYDSREIYLSDHKPVVSDFTITLPIVDNEERDSIVKSFLKEVDDQENHGKRPSITIDKLENSVDIPILKSSTIEVQLNNVGDCKLYFEVIDTVENRQTRFPQKKVTNKAEPSKGVMPSQSSQIIRISATLPIGCTKFEKTLVLRIYKLQDFFITCTFNATKSYFGCSIDELNGNSHGGIPKPLYTLINYLTSHILPDMFDETKLNFTHELEKRIIRIIDEDQELDLKDLKRADHSIDGSSSRAVSRVLLLLLRNLDGGIVSSDLSTYLLSSFKGDEDILEKILESLPPLRANVLVYLSSFLRLCIENGITRDEIYQKFSDLLLDVPKKRKRDFVLNRTNYEKLRRDFLDKLI